jgi:anti-anti-sigma factor
MTFPFDIAPLPGGNGLALTGDLDLSTAPQLGEALAELRHGPMCLDLSELTHIDSSGINVLLSVAAQDDRAPLVILNPPRWVDPLFKLVGIDGHPHIEVQRDEARSAG